MTKYPPLYCYKKWNLYTIDLIVNSALYFASPEDFNDVFDSKPYFDASLNSDDEIKEQLKKQVKMIL